MSDLRVIVVGECRETNTASRPPRYSWASMLRTARGPMAVLDVWSRDLVVRVMDETWMAPLFRLCRWLRST